MVQLVPYIGIALVTALVFQTCMYVYAMKLKRVDVVDVGWGASFVVATVALLVYSPKPSLAALVVSVLVLVWGARLSWHIGRRFDASKTQDRRYTELMAKWPAADRAAQIYGKIFVVQAALAVLVLFGVIAVVASARFSMGWLVAGSLVWLFGFVFEAVADAQMRAFRHKASNAPSIMQTGLWRYSRHPNYFGELIQWWGLWLVSLGTSYWLVGLVGPLTITFLICFVSGLPPAERGMVGRKGWEAYKKRTNILVPLPPKKD